MKIEIYKNRKQIKPKKQKINLNIIDFDFSSIKSLIGNKVMLESNFQILKKELISNG